MKKRKMDFTRMLIILASILLLVLLVVFIVISKFLENSSKGKNNDKLPFNDESLTISVEEQGKYETNTINKEYRDLSNDDKQIIDNLIDNILQLINERRYAEMYQCIPILYKEMKFETLGKFKDYMKETFPSEEYECDSYRLDTNWCYIRVYDSAEKNKETIELKVGKYKNPELKNIEIYFDDILDMQNLVSFCEIEGVRINTKYIVLYNGELELVMSCISNKQDVTVDFGDTYVYDVKRGEKVKYYLKEASKIKLVKGAEQEISLLFDANGRPATYPSFIQFEVSLNGKKVQKELAISYFKTEDVY